MTLQASNYPTIRPSLDLNFAATKSLSPLVTFTRASGGTYIDSDGVLKTTSTNAPRFDHNPTTGESLGLLVEGQRTNLLLNSETLSTQSVTVTAAAHTLSFTGTGTITLSGASTAGPLVGTGTGEANRVTLTFTPTAGTLTLTVSGTVSNAQLEAGAFRTSYIPTTTSAATRAADVASITGTNFSSWYRQDEGTVFCEAREYPFASSAIRTFYGFENSSQVNTDWYRQWIWNGNTTVLLHSIYTGSGGPVAADFQVPLVNEQKRTALAYRVNDFARSYNGATPATDSSGNLPVGIDRVGIGSNNSALQLNGHIRRFTYWPQRLPNATLQAITL